MLNYNTLLSAYDDKLTLMQWLKKVEAALKDASAVSFNVNKRGDATITFSVVFEDGSELETDPIILQQGESVTGATITNGHLILTLSNGDTLDAGGVGAVSGFSINGSQHLIVTYQDGTTQDLGAIFNGNVNIAGTLTTSGDITAGTQVKTPKLTSDNSEIEAEKPVVEVMTGYSASIPSDTGYTKEKVYYGAVKNGNKLTLVFALNITKGAGAANGTDIANVTIPANVGAKLYPTLVGEYHFLDNKVINAFSTAWASVEAVVYIQKQYDVLITATIDTTNFVQDRKYFVRYEVTFLLSDDIA